MKNTKTEILAALPATQRQLAEKLGLTVSSIGEAVRKLTAQGLMHAGKKTHTTGRPEFVYFAGQGKLTPLKLKQRKSRSRRSMKEALQLQAEARAAQRKLDTATALKFIENAGAATAAQVGAAMGYSPKWAAMLLRAAREAGLITAKWQREVFLYTLVSDEESPAELRRDLVVVMPSPDAPLYRTPWFGVGQLSGNWSRA